MSKEQKIKEIIADSIDNITVDDVKNDLKLSELGADSLTAIEIVVALEHEYGVEVPHDFDPDSTVQNLIDFIHNNA